jgi:rubrerythrin
VCSSDLNASSEIAARSRGTPRLANNRLRWVRDYAQAKADGRITLSVARDALAMQGIDPLGLDPQDRKYLETIARVFAGGPVGVEAVAHTMNLAPDTLIDEVEPYLQRTRLAWKGTRMDIFAFAMEKEKFSEEYYRDLANRANHVGIKNIMTMLADEEAKHYRTVEQMKTETPELVADVPILKRAREVFEKIRGSPKELDFLISEADLYRKACQIEEQSKEYYLERAEEAPDPDQKRVFRLLAQEEDRHLVLMENLYSFVSKPQNFLENAERYHFDDYVEGVL